MDHKIQESYVGHYILSEGYVIYQYTAFWELSVFPSSSDWLSLHWEISYNLLLLFFETVDEI
jgi:hypothetical protein